MTDLPKRTLGRTGLEVSTLGYGAMELRGAPRGRDISEEQAERILNAVLDMGINYIDTSIDYGLSEERIGKYISGRRNEYFLASKCGCMVDESQQRQAAGRGASRHDYSPENILAGVNQSLARLDTDYLDVLQFHNAPSPAELESIGALDTIRGLKAEGKARFIGVTATLPTLKELIDTGIFDVFQIPYSAMERDHENAISEASAAGGGVVIRGGAARGAPVSGGGEASAWEKVDLSDLLDGMSAMEFILRFTCTHPDMDTTIVGTVNPEHLQGNVNALLKGPLAADVYEEAKRRLAVAGSAPVA